MEDLDRAYGDLTEMFGWIKVPSTFSAGVETFDRIEHADALMFGATRLILQMIGWLVSQQLAVTTFILSLEHERGRSAIPPTILEIALAEPAWKDGHLIRLLKERLDKVELIAPVIGLRLDALQLGEFATSIVGQIRGSPSMDSPSRMRQVLRCLPTHRAGSNATSRRRSWRRC